jgi:hypothetical protein
MVMKHFLKLVLSALAGLALAAAPRATANVMTFDLQFSGANGDVGVGQVSATEISPGTYLATSGTFALSAGPLAPYSSTLVTIPGNGTPGQTYNSELYGGTVLTYDDLIVQTPSAPGGYAVTYAGGLLFNDAGYAYTDNSSGLAFYLSLNGPDDYAGNYDFWSGGRNNEAYLEEPGTLTISAVPDGGTTLAMLGAGLFGLGWLRRGVASRAGK